MLLKGLAAHFTINYVGILMYAVDLLLISASNCDLRKMIKICEGEVA